MKAKKFICLLVSMALIFCIAPLSSTAAESRDITVNPINILVGGKTFLPTDPTGKDIPVFEYNGTTYAPLRALAESYGLSVGYDAEQRLATVTGTASYKSFIAPKGTVQAMTSSATITVYPINIMVNGEIFQPLDPNDQPVYVFTYNGTTYAPLRALAQTYGLKVGYDHTLRLATVDFNYESEVLGAADERRNEILNSETEIVKSNEFIPGETYTGTAYYVSSSEGKDGNNGRSPSEPIRDIGYVNGMDLKPGDIVFFKRGDTWRITEDALWCREGVTYSAYGEGAKPLFTGSPENGAESRKWKLAYEDEAGKKIWKFYRDMPDTGGIVVNDGETVLERNYGWWNGDGYTAIKPILTDNSYYYNWELISKGPQSPETSLENLEFCCMIDYSGQEYPIVRYTLNYKGGFYLRCDEGNPGEVFDSIEFMTQEMQYDASWIPVVRYLSGTVLDNLNISCWSNCAMSSFGDNEVTDVTVQNCEVAYGGNGIHEFISAEPTTEFMLSGDGIYGLPINGTVRNNYVHDVDGGAITFESAPVSETLNAEYFNAVGNLVERCGAGIQLNDGNNAYHFDSIRICDNVVVDTGGGWTHNCFCTAAAICVGTWGEVNATDVQISSNIMYGSTMFLMAINGSENIHLSDNSYFNTNSNAYLMLDWQHTGDINETKSRLNSLGENGIIIDCLS